MALAILLLSLFVREFACVTMFSFVREEVFVREVEREREEECLCKRKSVSERERERL